MGVCLADAEPHPVLELQVPFLRLQRKWPSIPLPDAAFTLPLLIRMEYLLNARLGWAFGGEKQASGQVCSVDDPCPSSSPSFQLPGLEGVRPLLAGPRLPCAALRGHLTNIGEGVESLEGVSSSLFTWLLWVLLVLTRKKGPALFTGNAKNFLAPLIRKGQKPLLPGSRRSRIVY